MQLASSLSKVIPAVLGKKVFVPSVFFSGSGSGFRGSPLADHPAATSAPRGSSYAGRRFLRGGRQRGAGGREGYQAKANLKAPKNSSVKRGFQE